MKLLSFRSVALATVLLILCSNSGSGKEGPRTAYDAHYYFYSADTDTFVIYSTVNDEIVRLEDSLQVFVDNDPLGGTLLEKGYINNAQPHSVWPSEYMYAHY